MYKRQVQGFYRFNIRPDLDYILAQADSKTTVDYELMAVKNGWFLSEFTPSPTSIAGSLPISQEYYYANKYYGTVSYTHLGIGAFTVLPVIGSFFFSSATTFSAWGASALCCAS